MELSPSDQKQDFATSQCLATAFTFPIPVGAIVPATPHPPAAIHPSLLPVAPTNASPGNQHESISQSPSLPDPAVGPTILCHVPGFMAPPSTSQDPQLVIDHNTIDDLTEKETSSKGKPKRKRISKNENNTPEDKSVKKTRKSQQSWRKDSNSEGKSSLDLIVEWLIADDHYSLWRGGKKSKRDVSEMILEYLMDNGIKGRDWRGIEQQVVNLEKKHQAALDWKNLQTGRSIRDDVRIERAQFSDNSVSSNTLQHSPETFNNIDVELKRRCFYFFNLDPVFSAWASSKSPYVKDRLSTKNDGQFGTIFGPKQTANYNEDDSATSVIPESESEEILLTNPSESASSMADSHPSIFSIPSGVTSTSISNQAPSEIRGSKKTRKQALHDTVNCHRCETEKSKIDETKLTSLFVKFLETIDKINRSERFKNLKTKEDKRQETLKIAQLELEVEEKRLGLQLKTVEMKAKLIQDFLKAGLTKEDAMEMSTQLIQSSLLQEK